MTRDSTARRRWGRAGVQLTPQQAKANDSYARASHNKTVTRRAEMERAARTKWAAGLVVPYFITIALDSHSLDGPEVDAACGAAEPDVDMWEAGVLYPTWDQLRLLSELTDKLPLFFVSPPGRIDYRQTSLRFHYPEMENIPPPVWKFTDEAIAAMKATL